MLKFQHDLFLTTPTEMGMGDMLVNEEPMMNKDQFEEGPSSLGEEMYRQEIYKKHAAVEQALTEKGTLAKATEISVVKTDGGEISQEDSDEHLGSMRARCYNKPTVIDTKSLFEGSSSRLMFCSIKSIKYSIYYGFVQITKQGEKNLMIFSGGSRVLKL